MQIGDRVQISPEGRRKNIYMTKPGIKGEITGWRHNDCALVLWDGNKNPSSIAKAYIAPVEPSA